MRLKNIRLCANLFKSSNFFGTFLRKVILYILLSASLCSFAQKSSSSFYKFKPMGYVGTFMSVSTLDSKTNAIFNDTLSAYANYMYDSILKTNIVNTENNGLAYQLPQPQLDELTKSLTTCVVGYQNGKKFNEINVPSKLDSICVKSGNRYNAMLLGYGKICTIKQHKKYITKKVILYTSIAVGIAIVAALAILASKGSDGGKSSSNKSNNNSNKSNVNFEISGSKNNDDEIGSSRNKSCFMDYCLLIYDSNTKHFCYAKKISCNNDRYGSFPFNAKGVKENIRKLCYRF